ncbi:uncharacterized protein [Mytilus edulis]|uniref:uncharacterized protein n=1 Tax=Mytilus edulis TaxID=6550 RepID=UPI0039EFBBA0
MIFLTSIHYFIFSLCIISQLLLCFCAYPSFSSRLEKDLKILSRLLPGYYSNHQQYVLDVTNEIPSGRRHLSLQTVIRPVYIPFLEDSFNVYIEQYVNNRRNKPFKQWLYSFRVDNQGRAIRMRNLLLRDSEKLKRIHKNLEYIQELTEKDIYSRENCDMLWRKLKKKYFHGATGRDCVAYVKGEKLRIETSATLDTRSLQWQEGWFKVSDGSVSLATEGPYIMKKVQKIKNTNYRPHNIKSKSSKVPQQSNNVVRRQGQGHSGNQLPFSDGISANQHSKIWNLETFDDITDKLTSGRSVYVVVDATTCSKSGYPVPNRFHFGMHIDNFEISLDKRKFHGDLLKFSAMKKVLHESDIKDILREVKVYRDGTVVVDYYIMDSFSNHVTQQAMAVCRIYNSQTKDGHVKFTSDPFKLVKSVKSFGALRASLKKGRDSRMVVDLTKCSHTLDKTTIIGGTLKDYDFLNSGNTIAATIERIHSNMDTESIITSKNAFALFSINNRMTLTLKSRNISKNSSDFFLDKTIQHRCIIGKDSKKNGLALFYSP